MADDATIRLRIDTRGAKRDLRNVTKDFDALGGGLAGRLRGRLLAAGAAVAGAAAIGATVGSNVLGSVGAIAQNRFGGIAASLDRRVLGDAGLEARASNRAVESAVQNFSLAVGSNPAALASVQDWYSQVRRLNLVQERGARDIQERLYPPLIPAEESTERSAGGTGRRNPDREGFNKAEALEALRKIEKNTRQAPGGR